MTSTTAEPTLVTFLLDRSGSMSSCLHATIEGFNSYLEELKKAITPISFTFLQFDYNTGFEINKVHFEKPIQDVPPIDKNSYEPRGGTPLVQAAITTIHALATAIAQKATKPKVVVCIQTDGEENQSNAEFTWQRLKDLITEYTAKGWQFNFMGAGIDAYDQGAKMGIAAAATMSYDHTNVQATRAAFASSGSNTSDFAMGASFNTDYTMAQRLASNDAHAQRVFGGQPTGGVQPAQPAQRPTQWAVPNRPTTPGVPLDLTTGGSHSVRSSMLLDTGGIPLDLTK